MRYHDPAVSSDTAACVLPGERACVSEQQFDEASLAQSVAGRIGETTVVGYVSLAGTQRRHCYVLYLRRQAYPG